MKLYDEAFVVKDQDTGEPIANQHYRIKRADGTYEEGTTDDKGHTHLVNSADVESLVLEFLES